MKTMKNQLYRKGSAQTKIITIPNLLSFLRLCLIPLFIWLYCVKREYVWTGIVLVFSGITDIADGFIARHFHMTSDLGKVLDPIADKLTQAAMLFCLCTRFPWMMVPLALMLVKELYMGIAGIMVIRKTGKVFGAKWHGKVTTCMLDALVILHVVWYQIPGAVSDASIAICTAMMVASLMLYGISNQTVLKESSRQL